MDDKKKRNLISNSETIDILDILKAVWKRAWIILICSVITAGIGFSAAAFFITPQFTSSIMLYVNNSSISVGSSNFSISSSEISAAQSLVKTYAIILDNRTTLEEVIKKADLDIGYRQLSGMIKSESVNDTEVLKITVTSEDPYLSKKIVNCIAELLPQRISEVIHGSSMEVFDAGEANLQKVSPSITMYTLKGFFAGFIISVFAVIVLYFMDSSIHDEEYVIKTYDYPILVCIPDLSSDSGKKYGYYSYYKTKSDKKRNNSKDSR